jgi:hypothetical protein
MRGRYRSASLVDKRRILDEFVALTGCHRKHAIRVRCSSSTTDQQPATTPPCERIWGEAVREAAGVLWEAADRARERFKPLLPILVTALERHGHLTLDPAVRERLLAASAATLDRLLVARRAKAGGPVRANADADADADADANADADAACRCRTPTPTPTPRLRQISSLPQRRTTAGPRACRSGPRPASRP